MRFSLLSFCVLVFTLVSGDSSTKCGHKKCGPNEIYTPKVICPPDTCFAIGAKYNCLNATSPPFKTGCRCKSGYHRLKEGSPCVPSCNCPQLPDCCGKNEEYTPDVICPPDTCFAIGAKYNCLNATSPPFKTGCRCKSGYHRLKEGSPCVPSCNCPQLPDCCGKNEEYTPDVICPPDTCLSITGKYNCNDATSPPFKTGCKCKSGYYRLKEGSPCVPSCNCPQLPDCCGKNEEYTPDVICPPDTCLSITGKYNCTGATSPPFRTGCKCKSGYYRLKEGSPCVASCNCPQLPDCCGKYEEYSPDPICPPDLCISIVASYNCEDKSSFKSGCKCISGYFRQKEDSPCIPSDQCKLN